LRENLPTVAKLLPAKRELVSTSPHIFLLYGEGGMGKTTLGYRFGEIAKQDFENRFEMFRVDWEEAKNEFPALDVGHEQISPESTLEAIYQTVSKWQEGYFKQYRLVGEKLKQIENKLDKELQARQGEGAEYAPILKQRLGFALGALRKLSNVEAILGAVDAKFDGAIADTAVNALVGLMKKRLSLEERRIFATPQRQLAEALGHGLQVMSAQKPLVMLLDTYEIVDRIECDRVLRMVIKASGQRVVWVIVGRANLADTSGSGANYSQGYRDIFSENLYVYPMSEFSQDQVSEYFSHPDVNVSLSNEEAESVKRFSLGIPLVVQEIAEMCQKKIPLAEIISPPLKERDDESPYQVVVRVTIQRFLRYCFDDGDKRTIYAIAMMRRPDNRLLQAMLGDVEFEQKIQSLKTRHSFVLIDGKIRLHEKLERFLQDYLCSSSLDGQSAMVRELSDRAIAYLEPRLSQWQKEFTDTADFYESDRIANGMLDLVQFKFWQDTEIGWHYAVSLFVESWQYNRDWQRQLLGIIEAFQVRFDADSKKRLQIFTQGIGYYFNSGYYIFNSNSESALISELEKLSRQGRFDDDNHKSQYKAILSLQQGKFNFRQGNYSESLQIYLKLEKALPKTALRLQKDLAAEYKNIGDQLGWAEDKNLTSSKALTAYQHAVKLDEKNADAWYGLGAISVARGENKLAIEAFNKSIKITPKFASPYNGLGNVYLYQEQFLLAVASYKSAIDLESQSPFAYNGLGNAYQALKDYELAIEFYENAIRIDDQFAYPYNGLGSVYQAKGDYEDAINYYKKAISIDPKFAYARFNLGFVLYLEDIHDEAVLLWKQGLELLSDEHGQYEKFARAWHEILIGETEQGTIRLREVLETKELPVGILSDTLQDATKIMARFPAKLEGIDTVIEMLQQAIQNTQ